MNTVAPSGKNIAIVGAGLVGSLLSVYLSRRGYSVTIFERRPDMRKNFTDAGRSINLALSNRGLRALREVGLGSEVRTAGIPMHGRMMHDLSGKLSFLPYGKEGEFINSISRKDLNIILLNAAENAGARIEFNHKCIHVSTASTTITAEDTASSPGTFTDYNFDTIIGTDGAWSAVRSSLQTTQRFNYTQSFIDHGYKELHIPAGKLSIEKNALHIWPRESFMMIALPNPDGSFTATLFYPLDGASSFKSLTADEDIIKFFEVNFADFTRFNPGYLEEFKNSSIGDLVTIACWPWSNGSTVVLGDAAHAIVPFYGQGMNAGFEDCRILNQLLDKHGDDWRSVINEFQLLRKQDTDAIAQLALNNFIEMRDLVADPAFLLRKKIEAHLHTLYPDRWIPLYSMVTFHDDIRYSEALQTGDRQRTIMDQIMAIPDIAENWEQLDFSNIVAQLN